jgi:UDP-glucose 4-epimerase
LAAARHAPIAIFGTDYDTPDGTCVRDYVHVADLCDAHLRALDVLVRDGASSAYNLGSRHGYSVREVIDAVQMVTGRRLRVEAQPCRAGDPPYLVAHPRLAQTRLGWQPRYDLHAAIDHAWRWQTRAAPASVQVG